MASKRFGAQDIQSPGVKIVLMEGAAGVDSVVNIRAVNRLPHSVWVKIAIVDEPAGSAVANLALEDYIEHNAELPPQDVMENSGLTVPAGYSIVVSWQEPDGLVPGPALADPESNGVTFAAYGFEELI